MRALENGEVQRVGSLVPKRVDVTVIAASNRDLRQAVEQGTFREDLFYRLSSVQIVIPPLAHRLEDVPLLIQFFLNKFNEAYKKHISGLTRRAQKVLLRHQWPGNVRELENVISSACITVTGDFTAKKSILRRSRRHLGRRFIYIARERFSIIISGLIRRSRRLIT